MSEKTKNVEKTINTNERTASINGNGKSHIIKHSAVVLLLLLVGLLLQPTQVQAQPWATSSTNSANIHSTNSGNVGIGTTTPAAKLQVAGDGLINTNLQVGGQGTTNGLIYMRADTVNPRLNLQVRDANGYYPQINFLSETGGMIGNINGYKTWGLWLTSGTGQPIVLRPGYTETNMMVIDRNGNVGIGFHGHNQIGYKLYVKGGTRLGGDVIVDGNLAAKYQDVAEWVESSQQLTPGTVVILDPERTNQVLASTTAYDTRVAGVISAQPGLLLGEAGADKVKVATTGRVKVRVDARRKAIKVGDLLVTSGVSGVAMRSEPINIGGVSIHRPGTIVGKALEPLEAGKTGEILVLLSLQ